MAEKPLEGKLEKVPLPQVLRELYLEQTTGVLDLRRGKDQRRIIFDGGDVRSARSNRMEQRIGQFALKSGVITRIQLMQALSVKDTDTPTGQRLVNMGFITEEILNAQLKELVREIIVECFGWDNGEYRIRKGRALIPSDTEIRMSTADIIFQGFKAFANERMARRMIGNLNSALIPNPNLRLLFQHITLSDDERDLLDMIDGLTTTAQLVCTLPGESSDNIILLGSLTAAGLLSTKAKEGDAGQLGFPEPPGGAPRRTPPTGPQPREAATGPPRRRATTGPPQRAATTPSGPSRAPQAPRRSLFTSRPKPKQLGLNEQEVQRMRKSIKAKYAMLSGADHYRLLGLPLRATQKEIFYSFKNLCTLFHPDLALKEPFSDLRRELEAVFRRLEEAYETLVDTESRKKYDRSQRW